jgi:hypothetical protein
MGRKEPGTRGIRSVLPAALLASVTFALAACGGGRQTVVVPPRVELAPLERIGLVLFSVDNADAELGEQATQRFAQHLLNAQWGYELLELGPYEVEQDGPARTELARFLGEEYGLGAVFLGHVEVSDVRPRASFLRGARVGADVTVQLTIRMLAGGSGGTLWTRSARVQDTLAEVSLEGGEVTMGAEHPGEVYGALVNRLLSGVTGDFRSTTRRVRR